jgi:Ca2+-binding EF-hand superfamily protein
LTEEAKISLERIFWNLDEDHDGILNKKEVKQVPFIQIGANSKEFLEMHINLIKDHESEKVWKILNAFHYDTNLFLNFDKFM